MLPLHRHFAAVLNKTRAVVKTSEGSQYSQSTDASTNKSHTKRAVEFLEDI